MNSDLSKNGSLKVPSDDASSSNVDGNATTTREVWGNRLGFILSVMGYNIGLGNILRFPYLVMKNGGGAFLIPYFFFLFTVGIPIFVLELGLGQYSAQSPLVFYQNMCPILKGIGWCNIISCFCFNIYYMILMAWICYYLVHSFFTPLPWSHCNNTWSSTSCIKSNSSSLYNISESIIQKVSNCSIYTMNDRSPTEEFYENNLLELTSGIDKLGIVRWELLVCLFASWMIIYLCLAKGIKSLGKVVYVTALGPYIFLIILFIRGLMLPAGRAGVKYYLLPEWSSLATATPWVEAAQQIFWSLAPAWGGTICMSSHNKFKNNIYRDSLMLPLLSALTSFFGGFVTFAYIGDLAMRNKMPINCVLKAGPGLAFNVYPAAFDTVPLSQLWSVIFFILLLFLGMDSAFTTFETMYQCLVDAYSIFNVRYPWLLKMVVCFISFVVGIPMVTQGGFYIYQLIDWYQVTFMMGVAFVEVLGMAHAYGSKRIRGNIRLMTGVRMTVFWDIIWGGVLPLILAALFIVTIKDYRSPSYGSYKFPGWSVGCGWLFASLGIIPIPIYIIYYVAYEIVKRHRHNVEDKETIKELIRRMFSPTTEWERQKNKSILEDEELQQRYARIKGEIGCTTGNNPELETIELKRHSVQL